MKKYVLPLAAAIMVAAVGTAHAGKIVFTAYKDGKQAAIKADPKAKTPSAGAQIDVVTQAAYDKMAAAKKKNYSAVDMCGEIPPCGTQSGVPGPVSTRTGLPSAASTTRVNGAKNR